MRISLPPPRPDQLQRLEVAAAKHPRGYRIRLTLLAIFGDATLTFVRAFPIAGPIVVGALILDHMFFYVQAILGVTIIIWVMRPGYRDSGETIEPKQAPELYAAL